jgi:hypothetical protein
MKNWLKTLLAEESFKVFALVAMPKLSAADAPQPKLSLLLTNKRS